MSVVKREDVGPRTEVFDNAKCSVLQADWGQLIGDVPSATAILDRFLHRAEVVQITGKSYRLEKSRKSSNDTKAPTGSPAEE